VSSANATPNTPGIETPLTTGAVRPASNWAAASTAALAKSPSTSCPTESSLSRTRKSTEAVPSFSCSSTCRKSSGNALKRRSQCLAVRSARCAHRWGSNRLNTGLPETDNFQHWPPWRSLVVETARRILDYTGGTLVMPMTVLVEQYWREISDGLAFHAIPVRHFVLHADQDRLRQRIEGDTILGPSSFRLSYLDPYAEAFRDWLRDEAEVIDTTDLTPAEAALQITEAVKSVPS
jgi:hypothetical protein